MSKRFVVLTFFLLCDQLKSSNQSNKLMNRLAKIEDKARLKKVKSKFDNLDDFYKVTSLPLQSPCKIQKRIGGQWGGGCGFLDGEKLICLDKLYESIMNQTCLVYSFGLADNWDFEILMAQLGCTVRCFDPSSEVKRPPHSFLPNIHFHNVGIGNKEGLSEYLLRPNSETEEVEPIAVKSLNTLIQENGDEGKRITYLKMDVEGTEFWCFDQWLTSGVMAFVDQFGIEMHTGSINFPQPWKLKSGLKSALDFFHKIKTNYNLTLADYNPNLCQGKRLDYMKQYYSYFDLLFVKI